MKISQNTTAGNTILPDTNSWIRLFIEIITICVLYIIGSYILNHSQPNNSNTPLIDSTNDMSHTTYPIIKITDLATTRKYWFLVVLLIVIIIHNLVIGGWRTPKDLVFIGILLVMGVWFCWQVNYNVKQADTFFDTQTVVQALGPDAIDYNLHEAGRDDSESTQILGLGTNINKAHPDVAKNELIWGNRPEHYDFVPDDIPGYLELKDLRKLKRLQKKVKRDKNYKYLAEVSAYDPQSMSRPANDSGTEFQLHMQHGLDNKLLAAAYENEAYKLPKAVLDALSGDSYHVWKEGDYKFGRRVNGDTKYVRNNGVLGSWYKYLKESEPTFTPDVCPLATTRGTTTTTRQNDLKTSTETGTGPVMQANIIPDEMIEANNKFRTTEYFTVNSTHSNARFTNKFSSAARTANIQNDTNLYSMLSDGINTRMPGSSDKISQYATNYPLVSIDSLTKINDNCARRLDGSCPKW